jgi:2-(1,2-epoxy-1,2-dihydrophenyl)acetyl-CoA isomerase
MRQARLFLFRSPAAVAGVLLDEAGAMAARLAKGPTRAFAAIKAAIAAAERSSSLEKYLVEEARLQGEMGRTEDYRGAVVNFLEKQPTTFKGS